MISKIKEAEILFDRGINYFRGGFYSSALREFISVKKLDENYPNIDYIIEAASKKNKEVAGKLANFIEENFTDEIERLSNELEYSSSGGLLREIESLIKQHKVYDALKKIEQAENIIPDAKPVLLLKANLLRRIGEIKKAEKLLERANNLHPNDFEILNNLGNIYLSQSQFIAAEKMFEQARRLNEDDAKILNNIGSLKMQTYRLDEAEKYFRKAIALKADFKTAHRNLKNVRLRIRALDEEIEKLRREFDKHPNYLDIGLNLGKNLLFRGYFSEAARVLKKILNKNKKLIAAYFYLGILNELNENLIEALNNYEIMVMRSGKYNLPEFKVYTELKEQGYIEEALNEIKKIAIIELDLAAGKIELGIKYFEDCQWKNALKYFEEATELNDKYPDAFYWLALTHIQLGNITKAKNAFEKAIKIKDNYADAYFQLGMLLRKKSKKKAKEYLQKALKLNVRPSFAIIANKILNAQK